MRSNYNIMVDEKNNKINGKYVSVFNSLRSFYISNKCFLNLLIHIFLIIRPAFRKYSDPQYDSVDPMA